MNENITLIQNVKRIRKSKGLTGEMLAERTGKSYSYIRKFESGQVSPSYALLMDISKALDCSPQELFKDESSGNIGVDGIFSTVSNNIGLIELMAQLPKDHVAFEMCKDILKGAIESSIENKNKKEA